MICDDEQDVRLLFGLILGLNYNVIELKYIGKNSIKKYIEEKNRGNRIHLVLFRLLIR